MIGIEEKVREILHNVKENGDEALSEYSLQFDEVKLDAKNLLLDVTGFKSSIEKIPKELLESLKKAKENILEYHKAQFANILAHPLTFEKNNYKINEKITVIKRIGVYVPGGRYAYPSSVFMTVLPAKAAGVEKILVATPMKNLNDVVKAALFLAGVDKVLCVGGAQAIGAMAYGTQTIKKVDMIVGPGNAFVTEAKRQVFGSVGIDMIAGPSDITVWSDGTIDPDWVATDLQAQAEHDFSSRAILVSEDNEFIEQVRMRILDEFKKQIIFIKKKNVLECIEFINQNPPEHLEVLSENNEVIKDFVEKIHNVGAIFEGKYVNVAMGDYFLGPSHTLPTNFNSKFSSGLSVHTFVKRSAVMNVTENFIDEESENIAKIADAEGLEFHAKSIRIRQKK